MGDIGNAIKAERRERRVWLGVKCPPCAEVRPRACASILLPRQRRKVGGSRDPRPRGDDA